MPSYSSLWWTRTEQGGRVRGAASDPLQLAWELGRTDGLSVMAWVSRQVELVGTACGQGSSRFLDFTIQILRIELEYNQSLFLFIFELKLFKDLNFLLRHIWIIIYYHSRQTCRPCVIYIVIS
jgi:hypothetical protein